MFFSGQVKSPPTPNYYSLTCSIGSLLKEKASWSNQVINHDTESNLYWKLIVSEINQIKLKKKQKKQNCIEAYKLRQKLNKKKDTENIEWTQTSRVSSHLSVRVKLQILKTATRVNLSPNGFHVPGILLNTPQCLYSLTEPLLSLVN